MNQPLYIFTYRMPKKGDLVQCMFTGQIWKVLLVCDNKNVIVGYKVNERGITEKIDLEYEYYYVLEKARVDNELPF